VLRVHEESGRLVMKRLLRRGGGCYALGLWRRTIKTGFDSEIVFGGDDVNISGCCVGHQLANSTHDKRQNFGGEEPSSKKRAMNSPNSLDDIPKDLRNEIWSRYL